MYIFISELSILGQAESHEEAQALLYKLVKLSKGVYKYLQDDPICTKSDFYNSELHPGYTIKKTVKHMKDPDVRELVYTLFTKGPYIEDLINNKSMTFNCYHDDNDVTISSISATTLYKGLLISFQKANSYNYGLLEIKFETENNTKTKYICNLNDETQTESLCWKYKPSQKHRPPKGHGTHMDLSKDEAQPVLLEALLNNFKEPNRKKVYNYYNGSYYTFMPDNTGGYHGYPVNEEDVPPSVIDKISDVN